VESYLKFIREIRIMATQLPKWRFITLAMIGLFFALGYLAGNLHWIRWW